MTEQETQFPFDTLEGWDTAQVQAAPRPSSDVVGALLDWLLPDGAHRHTVLARAIAMRYVLDPGSMGNVTIRQAARRAGISHPQFIHYVLQFENFFRIHSRPNKLKRAQQHPAHSYTP